MSKYTFCNRLNQKYGAFIEMERHTILDNYLHYLNLEGNITTTILLFWNSPSKFYIPYALSVHKINLLLHNNS